MKAATANNPVQGSSEILFQTPENKSSLCTHTQWFWCPIVTEYALELKLYSFVFITLKDICHLCQLSDNLNEIIVAKVNICKQPLIEYFIHLPG